MSNRQNNPKKIIIHCADTPDEGDKFGFKEINEWHRERGWLDSASGISCGYHYVVRSSGVLEQGRPEGSIGAHCYGENKDSIGICLIGRERVSLRQLASALKISAELCIKYQIPYTEVFGHYEFDSGKTCPGQDMVVFRALLKSGLEPSLLRELKKLIFKYGQAG